MSKSVEIFSYAKVWKVEKKIYAIGKFILPTPINPYDLLGYVAAIGIVAFVENVIPVISQIPFVLRYIALPLFVTNYLMKKKLDGKNPAKYFVSYLKYFILVKGTYLQVFKKHADKKQNIKLSWNCSMGCK